MGERGRQSGSLLASHAAIQPERRPLFGPRPNPETHDVSSSGDDDDIVGIGAKEIDPAAFFCPA